MNMSLLSHFAKGQKVNINCVYSFLWNQNTVEVNDAILYRFLHQLTHAHSAIVSVVFFF